MADNKQITIAGEHFTVEDEAAALGGPNGSLLAPWGENKTLKYVGKPIPKKTGWEKVTGRGKYAYDIQLSGMLHARILRSPHANAEILGIDVSAAKRLPGVRTVLTYHNAGRQRWDQHRAVFKDYVRMVGDEVAAVAADTELVAEDALRLIKVQYEVLPHVVDLEDALQPDAPRVQPYGNLWNGRPGIYERGDLEKGFREADVIIERTYTTSEQHHACLEMHGCVADWTGDQLTLWDSTQGVHLARDLLALKLHLPISKVRIVSRHTGGGFGSKNGIKEYHLIAAMLSRETGRPVRLFLNRSEDFMVASHRPRTRQKIKAGFKADGTLTAIDYEEFGRGGAWNETSMNWAIRQGDSIKELYKCSNVRSTNYAVHTNLSSPGACRGPGNTETLFALEQFFDEAALHFDMDPIQLRLKNFAEIHPLTGQPYFSNGLKDCYAKGSEAFGWKHRKTGSIKTGFKRRGFGMGSVQWHGTSGEPSQALVTVYPEGTVEVNAGIADIGVGALVVLAEIAAEELQVPMDKVQVSYGDSAGTPYTVNSSYGSRTTALAGPAVRMAAADARQQLIQMAAEVLRTPPADVQLKNGVFLNISDPGAALDFTKVAGRMGWHKRRPLVIGKGRRLPNPAGRKVDVFGAHFVEVEVDMSTGAVRVLRSVLVHDSGRPMNALTYESQVQGGFLMGLGMALFEERIIDAETGVQVNADFHGYCCPTARDVPDQVTVIPVETYDLSTNINAKGVGEPSTAGAGAAIANAVCNATGLRFRDYPITPVKILQALNAAG